MTQYTYHSGPLAEVKTIVTTESGRTVAMTYKPPMSGPGRRDVPASVEIKFANGAARSFNAETGEWITETQQGKKEEHGHHASPGRKRNPDS